MGTGISYLRASRHVVIILRNSSFRKMEEIWGGGEEGAEIEKLKKANNSAGRLSQGPHACQEVQPFHPLRVCVSFVHVSLSKKDIHVVDSRDSAIRWTARIERLVFRVPTSHQLYVSRDTMGSCPGCPHTTLCPPKAEMWCRLNGSFTACREISLFLSLYNFRWFRAWIGFLGFGFGRRISLLEFHDVWV